MRTCSYRTVRCRVTRCEATVRLESEGRCTGPRTEPAVRLRSADSENGEPNECGQAVPVGLGERRT